jgi:hypothetical protein
VLVGFILFYFPKSHNRAEGADKRQLFKEIDVVGGFLSISGIFLLYVFCPYSWHKVLTTLKPVLLVSNLVAQPFPGSLHKS